ncbi:MAG: cell division protein ZapB [Deltaproteobacteria bacterium]|nr:cell division protein ZapB [Deltaproteobacteria bacterium]
MSNELINALEDRVSTAVHTIEDLRSEIRVLKEERQVLENKLRDLLSKMEQAGQAVSSPDIQDAPAIDSGETNGEINSEINADSISGNSRDDDPLEEPLHDSMEGAMRGAISSTLDSASINMGNNSMEREENDTGMSTGFDRPSRGWSDYESEY